MSQLARLTARAIRLSSAVQLRWTRTHLPSLARSFHASKQLQHGSFERQDPSDPADIVRFKVIDRNSVTHEVRGKVGDNLMYLMHRFQDDNKDLMLEGACEASLACSTCHVILDSDSFDQLPEPVEMEDDMLDLASCLTATSRLGCQVVLVRELEGMTVTLPSYSKNFYVDGHTPTPH